MPADVEHLVKTDDDIFNLIKSDSGNGEDHIQIVMADSEYLDKNDPCRALHLASPSFLGQYTIVMFNYTGVQWESPIL